MTTKRTRRRIGRLLIIGGAEDPDPREMKILPHFVEMCGGAKARLVICGTPSETPIDKERRYGRIFRRLGVRHITEAHVKERADGERERLLDATQKATGVFFTGGDQLRLTSIVAGTSFGELVRKRLFQEGLIVGGTSAGAAAMASTMLIGGRSSGTVRRDDIELAPGLAYWRDSTIDTHFSQRGRVSRICAALSENPQILGIGIDENTAVELRPGVSFVVIGAGTVSIFDGRVTHSNSADVDDDNAIALTDVLLHVLPEGYRFDLRKERPLKPNGSAIQKRS